MESKELKWLQPTARMTSRGFRLYCAMDVKAARFPFSRSCSATIRARVERGRASVRRNKEIQRGVLCGGEGSSVCNGMKRKDQTQNPNPKTRTKNKGKIKEIDFTYPDGEVERQGDRSEIGRCEWQPCSRDQMLSVSPRSHENRP